MEHEKVKEIKKKLQQINERELSSLGMILQFEIDVNDILTLINELEGEITKLDIINGKLEMDIELLNKQNIDLEIDRDYYQEQFNEQEDFYVEWNKQQLEQFAERLKEILEENSPIAGYDLEDLEFDGETIQECIDETLKEFIDVDK